MPIYRFFLSVTLLLVSLGGFAQQDSLKNSMNSESIKLSEVVVHAKNMLIKDGKITITPTKQAKNLATDITSLIDLMNPGFLQVENGEIKTNSGQNVNIFINGQRIDDIEKSTFWAKNVKEIEYIPMSTDSQFLGESNVLNIIMKEYSVGGITKLDGHQEFPNNGRYSAASKLVVNKFTINALVNGGYSIDNFSGANIDENYNNIWYDGTEYNNILRSEKTSHYYHNKNLSTALNAKYTSDKFTILHGFNSNRTIRPENNNFGQVIYSPEIIEANYIEKLQSSKNYSYNLNGLYHYKLSKKTVTQFKWDLNYSDNSSHSSYNESQATTINNNVKENIWDCKLSFLLVKKLSEKLATNFFLNEYINYYNTSYSGYIYSNQTQKNFTTEIKTNVYLSLNHLILSFTPSLTIYSREVNNSRIKKELKPAFNFQGYYEINSKSFTNFGVKYYFIPPQPSMTNNLILRQTELKWIEGNPDLSNKGFYYIYAGYNIIPTDWCTLTANGSYSFDSGETCLEYRSGNKDYDRVIGQYLNGNKQHIYNLTGSILFKPFNSKLHLKSNISYYIYNYTNSQSLKSLNISFNAKYYFGNFIAYGQVFGPRKTLQDGGSFVKKTKCSYHFGISYGNGNINAELRMYDIFNKRRYEDIYFKNTPYSYYSQNYERGRKISVSLTYTFDYGKKVERAIDINSQSDTRTSILGAD